MPAAIVHFLHAERVLEWYEKQDNRIQMNRNAFLWGAQGPDFLYCHRFLPWQKGTSLCEYAEKLHCEKPSSIFSAMKEYWELTGSNTVVLSYIFGFLCHYSLDRTCHPFIQAGARILYEQEPGQTEEILHNRIESALDGIMLRYEKGALPVEFDLKQTLPKDEEVMSKIADLYAFVLHRLYGLQDSGALLQQATRDARMIFGLLNDRTTLKKVIAERLERRKGKQSISCHIRGISEGDSCDYANSLLQEWNWPDDNAESRRESFFELYEASVEESKGLLPQFLTAGNYAGMTGEIPFV